MRNSMSPEEQTLRLRLEGAVREVTARMSRFPAPDELRRVDVAKAAAAVAATKVAYLDARWCIEQLDSLSALSEDGAVLVATSWVAFGIVEDVLRIMTAAIEAAQAA